MKIINKVMGYLNHRKIEEIADKHNSNDVRKGGKLPLIPFVLFTIFFGCNQRERELLTADSNRTYAAF